MIKHTLALPVLFLLPFASCGGQQKSEKYWKARWDRDVALMNKNLIEARGTVLELSFERTVAEQTSERLAADLEDARQENSILKARVAELERVLIELQTND